MKKTLLTTAAAVALLAGTGLASAQGTKNDRAPAATQAIPEVKAPENKAQDNKPQAQPNARPDANKPAAQNAKPQSQTTGQATPNAATPNAQPTEKPAAQTVKPKNDATGQTQPNAAQRNEAPAVQNNQRTQAPAAAQPNTAAQNRTGGSVTLTADQKTKIRTTVLQGSNAPRVANVNFSLNVGVAVPRTVHVVPVPVTLVEIHPAWRGFMYFIVGDQIVVVDPRTLQIVEVLMI